MVSQAGKNGTPPLAVYRQVVKAESDLYQAQIAGDVEQLLPMLGANLVYIHSTGVAESRNEYLSGVKDLLYEYGSIASRGTRVQVFAEVAMITGIVDMTVSAKGTPKELIHLLFCLVWIRSDDAWKLDFRQATRIPSVART
jgi:hypothetical protein